jgi:predicted transcriptional regulator
MATHPLTIEPDLRQKLETLASRQTRSPEMLLRDAIEQYLQREEGEAALDRVWDGYNGPTVTREAFLREGEEAYQHYKKTGLHVTGDEVKTWLQSLARGEDAELPECHT